MKGIKSLGISLNRKVLSEIAMNNKKIFAEILNKSKQVLQDENKKSNLFI